MKKLPATAFAILIFLGLGATFAFCQKAETKPTVGILVPAEHKALTEIVQGLQAELREENVSCKVFNAQGDPNIQKALIEKLVRERCDLIIPIGTAASQMTLHLAKKNKILCLAADASAISLQGDRVATVLDDAFSLKQYFHFFHTAFPHIHKISLVYSSSEKVAREIPLLEEVARSYNIAVQKLVIHTMQELYTISSVVSADSQAILVLKDHLIVSGIATLSKQAEKRKVFVMTSDEGSIISGGAFALGVKESEIGREGGKIAKTILAGISPSTISPQMLNRPFLLFINRVACEKQGINLQTLLRVANQEGVEVEFVGESHAL